jgi:hypothetical protein
LLRLPFLALVPLLPAWLLLVPLLLCSLRPPQLLLFWLLLVPSLSDGLLLLPLLLCLLRLFQLLLPRLRLRLPLVPLLSDRLLLLPLLPTWLLCVHRQLAGWLRLQLV